MGTRIADEVLQLVKLLLEGSQAPGQRAASSRGRDLWAVHDDYTKTKFKSKGNNCKAKEFSKVNF